MLDRNTDSSNDYFFNLEKGYSLEDLSVYQINREKMNVRKIADLNDMISDGSIVGITDTFIFIKRDSGNVELWKLKAHPIKFKFITYDALGNFRVLDEGFSIVKDMDNHDTFSLDDINPNILYGLEDGYLTLHPHVLPYANDIDRVVIETEHESFELSPASPEGDHVYFEVDLFLDPDVYGIFGTDFTDIPLEVSIYQGQNCIGSKIITLTATSEVFEESISISGIGYDFTSTTDSLWLDLETTESTYSNSHGIPYVVDGKFPVINFYDAWGTEPDYSIPLSPNSDLDIFEGQYVGTYSFEDDEDYDDDYVDD